MEPITMELELKVPKDKLPFIGIRFNDAFAAVHTNKEMVELYRKHNFTMTAEYAGGRLNIRIAIDSPLRIWHYNGVKFDKSKLQIFMALPTKQWNFGHVIDVNGRDQVIRTIPKNEVFSVRIQDFRVHEEY